VGEKKQAKPSFKLSMDGCDLDSFRTQVNLVIGLRVFLQIINESAEQRSDGARNVSCQWPRPDPRGP
jgi:hypothetical protein